MQNFRVSATGHSVNYLPEYVANSQGYFADEGLRVSVSVPKPWDRVLDELATGEADAVLGGIWVPSMYFGRGIRYTPFAQLSARAPLALVGRERAAEFTWAAMPGKVISMKGSNGASVDLFTKLLLRENNIDPTHVHFIQNLDGALLSRLFRGGMGDYLVVDYPSALALETAGGGHIVSALALTGGNVPWSVYYAEGDSDPERLEKQGRFVRALGQGMKWISERPAAEYGTFLCAIFPGFEEDTLISLVEVYKAAGMWTDPRINESSYDRWQRGIADGRLIDKPIPYRTLIDERPLTDGQSASAWSSLGALR